jgi:hypothetical protein
MMKYSMYTDSCGWHAVDRELALLVLRCSRIHLRSSRGVSRSYIVPEGILVIRNV